MATYRNSFYKEGAGGQTHDPSEYQTDAKPVEYRGFLIYERIKARKSKGCGCADTVIDGWCIQQTVTVQGAKERIDALLSGDEFEERAREKMKTHGIPVPGELFA